MIIERAAELLKQWDQKSLESSEIEERIDTDIKLGEIISWGPEELPAGPEVEANPELIIVEGRADVLNLLRIGIKNSIAVQGTQIPKSIIDLTKNKKSITAFLDGDRGGTIILNELLQLVDINFVARAPEGYEVEELTRKQLIKSLQGKKSLKSNHEPEKKAEIEYQGKEAVLKKFLKKAKIKNYSAVIDAVKNLEHGNAMGLGKNSEVLFNIPVAEVFQKLSDFKEVTILILDGILSKRLLTLANDMKIKFIACKNKEEDLHISDNITVFFI
jgi:DNA primase